MRLAVLVALDGSNPGGAPAPADGDAWLQGALAQLGFHIVDGLDDVTPGATLLVHVTGTVQDAVAKLRSLGEGVAERRPESALFLAELTHDGPPDESLVAAEHVEAVREALGARDKGHSALVAVRPVDVALESFAFTRLVVRAAQAAEDARASHLSEVVERLRVMPERHTVAQGYAHVRGAVDFEIGWNEGPSYAPLLALADGARDQRHWEHAIAGYRAALVIAPDASARASVYVRIGAVERARGDVREARRAYEKAREAAPEDHTSLEAMVALTSELADWKRYVSLAGELVARQGTPSEKVDLLFAIARTLVQELRDLPAAVIELEKARQIEPRREEVLEALRRAYRVLGEWKKLIEITGVLADEGPTEAERSARRFAQARIALDKLGDQQLAIAFLDAALTEDPTNDEALDVLVEVRTARGEVVQLGRALEELVARYDEIGDAERAKDARRCLEGLPQIAPTPVAAVPVFDATESTGPMIAIAPAPPTLEELPPESLEEELEEEDLEEEPEEDRAEALERELEQAFAMDALPEPALEPRPIDVPIFVAGETGLHGAMSLDRASVATDPPAPEPATIPMPEPSEQDDDAALVELEEMVAASPLDPELHARLFTLHTRGGRVDRAYLSALALEELGAAHPEHEALLDQCRPEGPLRLRALLDGPAWEMLRAPGSDDVIESLFGAVSPAAIAAQLDDKRGRRKLMTLDPERKQSQTSTVSIVASFHWAAKVLGVDCPELYIHDDVPGDIAAVPAVQPSTVIGPAVMSGLATKELAFLAARHLTYYRREHAALVHFASLPELTLLVLACVQMELPAVPIPQSVGASVASLRARIARHLTPADRSAMAAAVQRLESRGGRLDLASWVRSVELTAARAGLFLCGDLRSAMARLRSDPQATGAATIEQVRADLIAFTTSRAHAELRAEFALVALPRASGVRSREELAILAPGARAEAVQRDLAELAS